MDVGMPGDHESARGGDAELTYELPKADYFLLDGKVVLLGPEHRVSFQAILNEAIPELADRMIFVGYDWIGRPIGFSVNEEESLLLYDAIFDELIEFAAPGGLLSSSPLFDATKDNFGGNDYESFRTRLGISRLEMGKCAGFKVPPQLGGEVSAANLELYDLPVYWHFVSMLHATIGTLSDGTILKSIKVE